MERQKKKALYSVDIESVSKKEPVSKELLKDMKAKKLLWEKHSRKDALIAVGANTVIPGLGNYYLKKGIIEVCLVAASLVLILIFMSPLYPVNFVGGIIGSSSSDPGSTMAAVYGIHELPLSDSNPFSAYFSIPLAFIAFSWLHLIFLILKGKK
jgi:hypothetical protein